MSTFFESLYVYSVFEPQYCFRQSAGIKDIIKADASKQLAENRIILLIIKKWNLVGIIWTVLAIYKQFTAFIFEYKNIEFFAARQHPDHYVAEKAFISLSKRLP